MKQVVTRTVTYCRTPLDAVPDGNLWKRRKVEHEGTLKGLDEDEATIKEEGTDSESTAEIRTIVPEAEKKVSSSAAEDANIDPALKDA